MTRVSCTRRIPQTLVVLWVMLLAALPTLAGAQVATPVPTHEALARGAAWLADQQAEDGGFVGFSGSSDPGVTADALVALSAVRNAGVQVDGRVIDQAVRYLEQNALVYAKRGLVSRQSSRWRWSAVGRNPRDVATVNPLSIVETSARQGLIGFGIFDHALGVWPWSPRGRPSRRTRFNRSNPPSLLMGRGRSMAPPPRAQGTPTPRHSSFRRSQRSAWPTTRWWKTAWHIWQPRKRRTGASRTSRAARPMRIQRHSLSKPSSRPVAIRLPASGSMPRRHSRPSRTRAAPSAIKPASRMTTCLRQSRHCRRWRVSRSRSWPAA
ncbi:MAG: hypothetical protein KatS3mg059_1410 [Thermomicrobiales bacterium]|nr:MAG: hypothetical protein KatS3mg059_1410 [Thermomicrobiales bacterium]